MICQNCNKNEATIHVTDVFPATEDKAQAAVNEQHLCEICAQTKDLPHTQPTGKTVQANVWKLLQITAEQKRRREELKCKGCGMCDNADLKDANHYGTRFERESASEHSGVDVLSKGRREFGPHFAPVRPSSHDTLGPRAQAGCL